MRVLKYLWLLGISTVCVGLLVQGLLPSKLLLGQVIVIIGGSIMVLYGCMTLKSGRKEK